MKKLVFAVLTIASLFSAASAFAAECRQVEIPNPYCLEDVCRPTIVTVCN